ncbi:MAG: Gfo/Idh/MocA family oxidoreductase [Lachnospiraceae bacterium]|nr:Gfo/Idh/MocA family oxidoreductase [Lachnospiraceae bacterium]
MKKIRLGLIGCGGMMKNHISGVNYLKDKVELTAVCDIIRERAEDVASVLDNPYITTDYKDMVEYVDAVLVALPHDLHYECGVFFARHKKHVLMEKPLCNSEEECQTLINVCEEEGVVLMCAYPVRFWPGINKLKAMVDSGEYGKVIMMSIWTEQLTICAEGGWGNSARLGGGQFFSHGCHYVDIMLWFLGNPVKGMHFGTRVGTPWLMKEGTSAATIQFESGAIGYHAATWGARGTKMGYDFQIHTEKAMLEYDHYAGEVRVYNDEVEHKPGEADEGHGKYEVVWRREREMSKETEYEISHFVDCINDGTKPLTDGYSTLQGLRVIWAMYDAEKHNVVADLRGLGLNQ